MGIPSLGILKPVKILCTDRKNVTDFLYLVLHLTCKVTCYIRVFRSVLVTVLRTSIVVLSKSKSNHFVTWIANLTKLFLSVCITLSSPHLILKYSAGPKLNQGERRERFLLPLPLFPFPAKVGGPFNY